MSNEEEKRCPLCAEEMDWTDQQLKPCKCGYEVCVWCWHHIIDMAEKEATDGRCPACRTPYDKDRIVGLEANFQRVAANSCSRKQKQPKAKQKPNEVKDFSNVRVIQRKMAYIIGLPLSLADEDLLQRKDYFGQYGKVTKVSLSRTAGGTVQQFVNDTCSVYITFSKEEEAVRCIQSVHGYVLDGRYLRASFGTAKYCHAWLRNMPCNNAACLYLHSIGAEEDSFGKDEIAAVHTRNRVQEIVGAAQYLHNRAGSMLPSPVDEHLNNRNASPEESVFSNTLKDAAYSTVVASSDHLPYSKDKDSSLIKSSKHMTSFVDIVGRSCNSGSDKDIQIPNLCSDISSISINHDNNKTTTSDSILSKSSTKLYSEPFREEEHNTTKQHSRYDDAWWDTEPCNQTTDVNNNSNEAIKDSVSVCTNSVLNDGFQSLVKSDRIYRGSKSFSNEEIVEHLRRLDDGSYVNDDENSAAVESSIISNILSMDFDGCDDSVLPRTVAGLHGSSWNFQNNDQSRFSFANEQGYNSQELDKFSGFWDSGENHDSIYKPQYQVSRAQNLTPPGFSKPPPGFPSGMRSEQVVSSGSGSYVKNSMTNNHYRTPSIGNISNSSDEFIDPAIMVVGKGKSSSFDMRSTSFDDENKLWLLMQQQQQSASAPHQHHHHEPQYSQTPFTQQHHTPQFSSSRDDYYYGDLTSRVADQHQQSYNQQYSQPKYANGHMSNGYNQQLHLNEGQQVNGRSEVGFEKLLPGYGDYMFPSGDVYTRVFGM